MNYIFILLIVLAIAVIYSIYTNKAINDEIISTQPNDFFSKIYAICIPERKEHIKNLLESIGLNFELVDAQLRDELDLERLVSENIITENCKKNKAKGKIACHLSHLKALRMFLEDEFAKSCLIFEDDLRLPYGENETNERMSDVIKDLPNDWEILYFGRCWDKTCQKQKQIGKYLYDNVRPLCRHAYAVSRSGAEKILNYCLPMDKLNGDQMYLSLIYKNILNAYAVHPQIFNQNRENFGSTLENNDSLIECDSPKPKISANKNKHKILSKFKVFSPKNYFSKKNPWLC